MSVMDADVAVKSDSTLLVQARKLSRPGAEGLHQRDFSRRLPGRSRRSVERHGQGAWRADAIDAESHAVAAFNLEQARINVASHPGSLPTQTLLVQSALAVGDDDLAQRVAIESLTQLIKGGLGDVDEAHVMGLALACLQLDGDDEHSPLPLLERLAQLFPNLASLRVAIAERSVDSGHYGEALMWLSDVRSLRATRLHGFIMLALGRNNEAVAALRAVLRDKPADPDAAHFLAQAYWNMGARQKAVAALRRASAVAPGRRDIGLRLLSFLVDDDRVDEAAEQIEKVKSLGVSEDSALVAFQAQVALARGQQARALQYLRQAEDLARREGDSEAEALAATNAGVVALFRDGKGVPRDALAVRARAGLEKAPRSLALANMVVENLTSTEDAAEARAILTAFEESGASEVMLLRQRLALARLELNFSAARDFANALTVRAPSYLPGVAASIMLEGQVSLDWAAAAERAVRFYRVAASSAELLNNTAYVLSLAGRGDEALRLFDEQSLDRTFALRATHGLALMSAGKVTEGLREYRRAAEMADGWGRLRGRFLMTLHQSFAIRELGVADTPEVRASRLPAVPYPIRWETSPDARILQWMSERKSWWPLM